MNRLAALGRRVAENRDVEGAVEFARYVMNSWLCSYLENVRQVEGDLLNVDGRALRKRAEELERACAFACSRPGDLAVMFTLLKASPLLIFRFAADYWGRLFAHRGKPRKNDQTVTVAKEVGPPVWRAWGRIFRSPDSRMLRTAPQKFAPATIFEIFGAGAAYPAGLGVYHVSKGKSPALGQTVTDGMMGGWQLGKVIIRKMSIALNNSRLIDSGYCGI